jgi:type II secretory pathway component GspD/PulD (secretin)
MILTATLLLFCAAAQEPSTEPGFVAGADGQLEFHARDLNVRDAFRQLRQLSRRNIVVAQTVDATFSGDLYGMTPEQAIEMICAGASLRMEDRGSYLFVESAQYETRIWQLDYARAADLALMIEPLLNEEGRVAASSASRQGLTPSPEDAGGDDYANVEILIVRDLPENLERIERLVRSLDIEPQQVLLEAVILSAELEDDLQMGISFDKLSGITYQGITAGSAGGFNLFNAPISAAELQEGIARGMTDFAGDVADGGLSVGWIDGDAAMFVRALQQVTDTRILANTKIVALNKQRGELLLGRRDGYLTTTVTETSTVQTIEFLETGTQLLFRPFIGPDGMIRLELHPEDSDGGINERGLPFEETAELTTNILVRDGQTVVIGGLFRERTETTERKIPFLGDIPFAGALFRSTVDVTLREELVILLTPHVLDARAIGTTPETDAQGKLQGFDETLEELLREADIHLSNLPSTEAQN